MRYLLRLKCIWVARSRFPLAELSQNIAASPEAKKGPLRDQCDMHDSTPASAGADSHFRFLKILIAFPDDHIVNACFILCDCVKVNLCGAAVRR